MQSQSRKCRTDVNGLLDEVLELHERFGWSLVPVRGKKAVGRWKQHQVKAPSARVLQVLFSPATVTGAAVIHGPVSGGLVIRDFDDAGAYRDWKRSHRSLARKLPTVRTDRGFHVYFRGPSLFEKLSDGEYRGTPGQYTLVPPSRHPSGRLYEWLQRPVDEIPRVEQPGACGLLVQRTHTQPAVPPCLYGRNPFGGLLPTERILRRVAFRLPSSTCRGSSRRKWMPKSPTTSPDSSKTRANWSHVPGVSDLTPA
jgi:hypothetical protein